MKKKSILLLAALVLTGCGTSSVDEYVNFLYENLSLPDRTDYSRSYYTEQARLALEARSQMSWGNSVPEREFLHFVLPPRVGNEDLDTCRGVFFRELRPRLEGMTMQEAILEVNHWCHEHVTYRPTSARTLSPLATLRTAYGRCGEESVFLVAALRSVGIPARQVYTPRWAHTDDNHAWVEAWADGRWWFLGACEPEPILNMGWFNESASRGMLMHTKVFGTYDGPEEIVSQQFALTEINVIDNYAPTRKLTVSVLDYQDKPVVDATVEFKLYNYAEFFTVARKQTDKDGRAALTAGLGDMLVWVSTPSAFAFQEVHFATDSLVTIRLGQQVPNSLFHSTDLDVTPPPVSASLPTISPEQREENNRRLAQEDSIRHAYELTMLDQRSRGNYVVIKTFLDSASTSGNQRFAETLLATLPDKDLQDVTLPVLLDNLHANNAHSVAYPEDIAQPYLYSPRIERERLTAFKAPLAAAFSGYDLQQLMAWTRDSIQIIDDQNPQRLRMQPLGVFRSRTADRLGRDIFFVAACRSLGIPARINEINGKLQYYDEEWNDVVFDNTIPSTEEDATTTPNEGFLRLTYAPSVYIPDAKYYTHFTLSRLDERNQLQLLTYPEEATFEGTFADGVSLDAGTYVLTTGLRLADGSVHAHMQAFTIHQDSITTVPLRLRPAENAVAVIGSLNAEDLYHPLTPGNQDNLNENPKASTPDSKTVQNSTLSTLNSKTTLNSQHATSLLSTCGRGYYCLGLIAPNQEPTNHALRDISLVRGELEKWGRTLVLLFENTEAACRFNFSEFTGAAAAAPLPSTAVWGTDIDGTILQEVTEQQHLPSSSLPIFLICDSFNRVVFVQQGYTIGLGEQLLKVIQKLKIE